VSGAWAVALALGAAATVEDLRRRTLPNWLTVTGLVAGLAIGAGQGWRGIVAGAGGAAIGFGILLPLYWLGAMGGGDVKLMAAFGALLGPRGVLPAVALAAVFGAVLAAAVLAARPRTAAIPYAPAIVLGAWAILLGGV
jgi:prepilin peptidase CpaA